MMTGFSRDPWILYLISKIERLVIANVWRIIPPDVAVDGMCGNDSNLGLWESLRRRSRAELQKKGTISPTITGVMCMYTVESTNAGDRVGALNCHSKATNKKQNILTKRSLRVRSWGRIIAFGEEQGSKFSGRGNP